MSPRRQTRKGGWKPPRDRHEVVVAVLASLALIVGTATLVWFVRPNRNSAATPTANTVVTTTLQAGATTTTPATAPPTTAAPATTSSTP
jgi:hypothetical protein